METSTSFFTDPHDDYVNPVSRVALIGGWITSLILSCAVNAVVIVMVARLFDKQPAVRARRLKLTVILPCFVLLIFDAVVPAAMAVHTHQPDTTDIESQFTCEGTLALNVMSYMGISISNILVGAMVLAEWLRLQSFVRLAPVVHVSVVVVLLVASIMYGLVVIIPVFFLIDLRDETLSCHDGSVFADTHYPGYRMIHVATFLVPHCLVFWACLLLLVVYFTRPSSTPKVDTLIGSSPFSHSLFQAAGDLDTTTDITSTRTSQGSDLFRHTTSNPAGTQRQPGMMSVGQNVRFPCCCLLAVAVSFALGFVVFLNAYVNLGLQYGDAVKVWLSGLLVESLRGVFLPCCWLLRRELRAVWICCCKRRVFGRAGRIVQKEGEETEDMTWL